MCSKNKKHIPITFNSKSNRPLRKGFGLTGITPAIIDEVENKNVLSHLQPEILPYDTMLECLKDRGMSPSILKNTKCRKVVERLFYKHVTPKPQRIYKSNRKGLLLRKMRKKFEKTIKIEDWTEMVTFKSSKSLSRSGKVSISSCIVSTQISSNNERLKSPPALCTEKKAIQLNKTSASLSDIKIKDHKTKVNAKNSEEIHIKFDKPSKPITISSPVKTTVKLNKSSISIKDIKVNDHKRKKLNVTAEESPSKKVKLFTSSCSSPVKRESDSKISDAKKRKSIGWP